MVLGGSDEMSTVMTNNKQRCGGEPNESWCIRRRCPQQMGQHRTNIWCESCTGCDDCKPCTGCADCGPEQTSDWSRTFVVRARSNDFVNVRWCLDGTSLARELDAALLKAPKAGLLEAIAPWVCHNPSCALNRYAKVYAVVCDCGLDAALAALENDSE